jgi:predicted Zn-dependent peptidase
MAGRRQVLVLDNGMRIAMEEMDSIRSVSFGIWIKNGSRNETPENNGISHFIEHMMFKGTQRRTAKDIADDMDAVGGELNAYTTKEYTCYYTRTLDTHFDIALDVLSDMFLHSVFDNTDISKERNVINEEIDMYEDTPEDMVHDLLQQSVWADNPLGYSILGTKGSIASFDHDTLSKFVESRYTPCQTVVTIVGHFSIPQAVKKIRTAFEGFGGDPQPEQPKVIPPRYAPCVVTKPKEIEQTHLCLSFPGLPLGDQRVYALSILNAMFGGGMSSRLFQTIREQSGLSYSVYSYSAAYTDTGLFTVYAGFNASQAEQIIQLIYKVIDGFLADRVSESQLARTREQVKSNYLLSLEAPSSRMSNFGRSQLLMNRTLNEDEIIAMLDGVTLDSLYELAHELLKADRASLCVVGNLGDWDYEKIMNDAR